MVCEPSSGIVEKRQFKKFIPEYMPKFTEDILKDRRTVKLTVVLLTGYCRFNNKHMSNLHHGIIKS